MQTYINDYLHLNKGYSVEAATVIILMFGLGGGVGVIAGGAAGQLLYNWCVWSYGAASTWKNITC
jgi:predicted MFS family arabinose efflux permease